MKTLKILLILTVLGSGLFVGCSEDSNPLSSYGNSNPNHKDEHSSFLVGRTLVWHHDGLEIKANGEKIVSADAGFSVDMGGKYNLLITFDGWTNSDTSAYVSKVSISADGYDLLLESGEPYINRHHELYFPNLDASNIRFYIALWSDDFEINSNAKLSISNIKVYKY